MLVEQSTPTVTGRVASCTASRRTLSSEMPSVGDKMRLLAESGMIEASVRLRPPTGYVRMPAPCVVALRSGARRRDHTDCRQKSYSPDRHADGRSLLRLAQVEGGCAPSRNALHRASWVRDVGETRACGHRQPTAVPADAVVARTIPTCEHSDPRSRSAARQRLETTAERQRLTAASLTVAVFSSNDASSLTSSANGAVANGACVPRIQLPRTPAP